MTSLSLNLGILLALLCAAGANLAFLCKHRGASGATKVDIRHPLRSAASLWRQRWFAAGMLIGTVAWVLHVGAISLAPLSVVQAVVSGGIVLLAVMADRLFGCTIGRRQWWGLALTALGLVLLGITLPAADGSHSDFSVPALAAFEIGLFGLGALLIMGPRLGGPAEHHGVMLAAAAGILFGICNVAVKAISGAVAAGGPTAAFSSPWLYLALMASAAAFYTSARSLQDGDAVPIIAITGTASSICCIAGGILVFGDPLPSDALGIVLQAAAFVLVVVASALTPGPVRAARGIAAAPAVA